MRIAAAEAIERLPERNLKSARTKSTRSWVLLVCGVYLRLEPIVVIKRPMVLIH